MSAAVPAGRDPEGAGAQLARRVEAVRASLSRRRRFEWGAMIAAGLAVGMAAAQWGLPPAASALLAACATVALLALVRSTAPHVDDACAWLDARAGARGGSACVLWQSAVTARPPFHARLAREAARRDDGASPLPLRRTSALTLVAAVALVGFAALAGPTRQLQPMPTARSRPAGGGAAEGAAVPEAAPAVADAAADAAPRARAPQDVGETNQSPAAAAGGETSTQAPALSPQDLAHAIDPVDPRRRPQAGRSRDGAPVAPQATMRSGVDAADGAVERTRTSSSGEGVAPGAERGEGVGDAPASPGEQALELPISPPAARGVRPGSLAAPAAGDAVALRERADAPSREPAAPAPSSWRPTPLTAGRWALTAAERSYLLRWSRLRDAARGPHAVDGPPPPEPSAPSRREDR